MRLTKRQLKRLIESSLREEDVNEGLIDDASEWVSGAWEKTKSIAGEVFDDIFDYLTSAAATPFSKNIVNHIKSVTNDSIKKTLSDKDNQENLSELIKYFTETDDLKQFLKDHAKKPNTVDILFKYLEKKKVNIEDLSTKIVGKLIEKDVLVIDVGGDKAATIKKDKNAAVEISSAIIDSLEELNAQLGLDFFGIKIGKKVEKVATKKIITKALTRKFKKSK